jgi:ATP-dependent RNA helicase SUPV3L1/SUV3
MLLRFGRPVSLRQIIRRGLSTTRPCLRKSSKYEFHSVFRRLVEQDAAAGITSGHAFTGDIRSDLDSFLATVNRRIENLLYSTYARSQMAGDSLSDDAYEKLVLQFRDTVMSNLTDRMGDGDYSKAPPRTPTPEDLYNAHVTSGIRRLDPLILKYFKQYSIANGSLSLSKVDYSKAIDFADVRNPGEWYPGARTIRRKIIMHVGPTNSGKTYQALQKLKSAKSGWYGGPLRLLAHEIFNRMNSKGIKCNLKTGEEIRVVDVNAPITSSTIEMFSESIDYDVAVIDEIQMLADPQRGYAWTAALLGLKANEIHVCGEEAAVPLITKIAEELGEEVEVNKYDRLSPLVTEPQHLATYKNIRAGDCVVAFSRQAIFSIKRQIENVTGIKCALVYGALPPETRSMQADLFNDPESPYKVIVASDAIGMGLNLYFLLVSCSQNSSNIKRLIFETVQKYENGEKKKLYPPQVKQIAGRAGRFRVAGASSPPSPSNDIAGSVTTLARDDLRYLEESMATPNRPLTHAMLWPPWSIIEKFTQLFPDGTPLAAILSRFSDICKTSRHYRIDESDSQIVLAKAIENIPNIDLETRYAICFAPVSTRSKDMVDFFVRFAIAVSKARPVRIDSPSLGLPLDILNRTQLAISPTTLQTLEYLHKVIVCYCWLS